MKKVLKLINNETLFGECTWVKDSPDLFIENPWKALGGEVMPYMEGDLMIPLKAVQIHPMNILWSAPMDDFPELQQLWVSKTSGIII
jgi:hypothetical protein